MIKFVYLLQSLQLLNLPRKTFQSTFPLWICIKMAPFFFFLEIPVRLTLFPKGQKKFYNTIFVVVLFTATSKFECLFFDTILRDISSMMRKG